jgi:hypothetical protein
MYSDRGKATLIGAVETVVALPCRVMGAVASVTSGEVLLTRWSGVWRLSLDGIGRVGTGVRGPVGSGESELASEALRGRASRNLCPRP